MLNEDERQFTVSEAAAILAVSSKTLRRWDESKILVPFRDPKSNYRFYTRNQLEEFARKRKPKPERSQQIEKRSSTMGVTEADINTFVEEKVNLKREKLSEYRGQVDNLIANLDRALEEDEKFGLKQKLHFGSCAKKTAISAVSDLDVAVYLTPEKEGQSVANILSYTKELLVDAMKRYGMSADQFSLGTHCVRVTYKGSKVEVDVVPIIPIKGQEKNGWGLLAARDTGRWLKTAVPLHLQFIERRRKSFEKFVAFVRLTKWWKEQQGVPLKSFAIELIWSRLIDNEDIPDTFSDGFPHFFRYLVKTRLQEPIAFSDYYPLLNLPKNDNSIVKIYDPVNPDNNVTSNLSADDYSTILSKSQEAMNVLMMATCAPSKNKAIELWQRLLGASFNPYSS